MKIPSLTVLLVTLACCAGCGDSNHVTGKVVFPDGSPLTTGRVVFDSGSHSYMGSLGAGGRYSLLGNDGKPGIPKGEYDVSIQGAESADENPTDPDASPTPLIHKDFTQKRTSNLKCEVEGKTVFDITVQAP